ncbi:hypothetical protein [Pelomonas sp. KK5]|uniref:hypothetical protein n=1 Tax=Pelomonas sp. KK5 TaxID=1855730 RepID=UPI00097C6659|nr:hypothetical protein [Pelomonas sp. KK5]
MSESIIGREESRPQHLDTPAVLRHARRLAAAPSGPWLHAEVAQRMAERLAIVKRQPARWLQWSAFIGNSGAALAEAYKGSSQLWVEPTAELLARSAAAARGGWLQRLTGGSKIAAAAPADVAPGQFELLWANMALHAHVDLPALLAQWQQALAVDGFVMFSCLGPDSFVELRPLFARHGWGRTAPEWWDMHDIGDLVVGAGFADPVMDQERIELTWTEPQKLLDDLRELGGNVAPDRFTGLRTPRWKKALLQALDRELRGPDGRLRLTLEIVYGHAFKAAPKLRVDAETRVSLEQMREMVRRSSQ